MRTITQLREDIKILVEKLGDMRSLCVTENRDPNAKPFTRARVAQG